MTTSVQKTGAGTSHVTQLHDIVVDSLPYERDPAEIYRQSFATVQAEAALGRFDAGMQTLVTRLVHACGMVDIADNVAFSESAVAHGRHALKTGKPILCDCEMVRSGIIGRALVHQNPVICTLNDTDTPAHAKQIDNTRSAAAVDAWRDNIAGAIVVIGNAPTALFRLLEGLDAGWPKPALILGFPVGFVGAAESKAELARDPRGVPFVTLLGRQGGSAIACAGVNALSVGLDTAP